MRRKLRSRAVFPPLPSFPPFSSPSLCLPLSSVPPLLSFSPHPLSPTRHPPFRPYSPSPLPLPPSPPPLPPPFPLLRLSYPCHPLSSFWPSLCSTKHPPAYFLLILALPALMFCPLSLIPPPRLFFFPAPSPLTPPPRPSSPSPSSLSLPHAFPFFWTAVSHLSQGIRVRSSVTTTAHATSRSGTISSPSSPTFGARPFSLETRFRIPATPFAPLVGWGSARKGAARNGSARNSLAEGQGMGEVVKSGVTRAQENLDAFVRFTRPHTMIGTTISIVSVSLLAAASVADLNTRFLVGLLQAVVPALLANVYIVGLNQLFDIDIDKVNKPYLPLASGDFSVRTGVTIVTVCAVLSLALGILSGSMPLLATLVISMLLGTAYSIDLPFLRWKRFPVMAASCILAVRAVIVQLGFYSHMQMAVMQRSLQLSSQLIFATAFMCTFSIVIALFKDVPDVEGDRVFGIRSLSVRVGQKKVYWFCVSILLASYAAATIMGLTSSTLWSKVLSVVTHVGAATALWRVASSADLSSQQDITDVYMFIWKLFYLEYLFIPFLR
ncbi:unnamed protein product [Closterium sp. NIES-65]|nr:unnamed protein product [Closterium sp. NIES-65]